MRYTMTVNYVEILGVIWMPAVVCGQRRQLTDYDVENIRDRVEKGITRKNIESWLVCNAGDFSQVIDFHANITVRSKSRARDIDVPWSSEENELRYSDAMYASESEE